MTKEELVLASLSPANGTPHGPVQVQKLLFLIDRNLSELIGGPYFHFAPYHYGPFDKEVYSTLDVLAGNGGVQIDCAGGYRCYRLTVTGQQAGEKALETLPEAAGKYIRAASSLVRSLSFGQLVSAIYKAYPEMRVNSVFREDQ